MRFCLGKWRAPPSPQLPENIEKLSSRTRPAPKTASSRKRTKIKQDDGKIMPLISYNLQVPKYLPVLVLPTYLYLTSSNYVNLTTNYRWRKMPDSDRETEDEHISFNRWCALSNVPSLDGSRFGSGWALDPDPIRSVDLDLDWNWRGKNGPQKF